MIQGKINWPGWLQWLSTPEQWMRDFSELFIKMISYLIIVYKNEFVYPEMMDDGL